MDRWCREEFLLPHSSDERNESLRFFFSRTSEFASSTMNKDWLDDRWRRFFSEMKFFFSSTFVVVRSSSNEIHLIFPRRIPCSSLVDFQSSSRWTWSVSFFPFFSAEQLRRSNILDSYLTALQQVFEYSQEDHPPSIPLVKMKEQDLPLPDLSLALLPRKIVFAVSTWSRSQRSVRLLSTIIGGDQQSSRLVYQLKKVVASRLDVINADRLTLSPKWGKCLGESDLSPRTAFLRRQMKTSLMFICGSGEKYRQSFRSSSSLYESPRDSTSDLVDEREDENEE